jgi:anti-sigma regulatory factor (Ser/Thr protein kinase)
MGNDIARRRTHEVFGGRTDAVPRSRHLIGDRLRAWGLGDLDELVTVLELAVAELVTNAVQHGRAPIDLVMTLLPGRVRVEVHDHGGRRPAIRPTHTTGPDIGGWGLRLVDELVDRWGSSTSAGHTLVWVEHAVPATPPRGGPWSTGVGAGLPRALLCA